MGVDISYSGPTENPRLDRPARFLHVQVLTQDEPLPPSVRPAVLGGKSGLLASPSGRDYSGQTYFANHARFFWTDHAVKYVATLHNFGPGTEQLLGALIAGLRPTTELAPPRDARGRRVTTTGVPVAGPGAVVVSAGGVWLAGQGDLGNPGGIADPSLVRIDPSSMRVTSGPIAISRFLGASAIALAGPGVVWVAHRDLHRQVALRQFDTATGRFAQSIAAGPALVDAAVAQGTLWAVDFGRWPAPKRRGGTLERVNLVTDRIVARIPLGRAPAAVAASNAAVWVTNNLDNTISRIDPATNRVVRTIRVGREPVGIAAGPDAVWIANNADGTVTRIDPRTNRVAKTIRVGRRPRGVALNATGLWITNYLDDTVSRINPKTDQVIETIPVGAGPAGIAATENKVWVANSLDQTLSRIVP